MPTLTWLTRDKDLHRAKQAPFRILEINPEHCYPQLETETQDPQGVVIQGDNQEAKREVKNFNEEDVFTTPKPERLVQRILTLATNLG